jgi:CDP-paratose synthetase
MKILITGATGFIGMHLAPKLLENNNKLWAVLRSSATKKRLDKRIKIFVFDGNINKLIAFLNKEKFDGVIHLASLYLSSHTSVEVSDLISSNILFPTLLLEACIKAQIPWFINTGSFAQHYKNKKYSPTNLYSATKQAFEDIAQYYLEISHINFVTIKLFDTFGPGDTRPKIFSLWSKIAKTGEHLNMSPGNQIIDINFVENVADGFVKMVELLLAKEGKKFRGKCFTLSSGERFKLKKLSKIFEEVSGGKLNIRWGKRPYRDREIMVPWKKGRNVPGWKPKISLRQGIRLTLNSES